MTCIGTNLLGVDAPCTNSHLVGWCLEPCIGLEEVALGVTDSGREGLGPTPAGLNRAVIRVQFVLRSVRARKVILN